MYTPLPVSLPFLLWGAALAAAGAAGLMARRIAYHRGEAGARLLAAADVVGFGGVVLLVLAAGFFAFAWVLFVGPRSGWF